MPRLYVTIIGFTSAAEAEIVETALTQAFKAHSTPLHCPVAQGRLCATRSYVAHRGTIV